jgi:hypothetical protein
LSKGCLECNINGANPPKTSVHPYSYPTGAYDRLHIDHLGPIHGTWYLVIVDAYSGWISVYPTRSLTSDKTLELLEREFAIFGYPKSITSDNSTSFVSQEAKSYFEERGITHLRIAPYSAQSNGLAEKTVQSVKRVITKSSGKTVSKALTDFLLLHRRTPQAHTGRSPAELMLGRQIPTKLDRLVPNHLQRVHDSQEKRIDASSNHQGPELKLKSSVWILSPKIGVQKRFWMPATVLRKCGPRRYQVQCTEPPNQKWYRHIDAMRARVELPLDIRDDYDDHDNGEQQDRNEDSPNVTFATPAVPPDSATPAGDSAARQPHQGSPPKSILKTPARQQPRRSTRHNKGQPAHRFTPGDYD